MTVEVKIGSKVCSTLRSTEVAGGGEVLPVSELWGFPLIHQAAIVLGLSDAVAVAGKISAELLPYVDQAAPVLLDGGEKFQFDVLTPIYT